MPQPSGGIFQRLFGLNIDYEKRVYGLDVFRAVAIIMVLLGHSSFLIDVTPLSGFPYVPIPDGVELFFVLSGFLIGGILMRQLHQNPKFGWKELVHFWKRRWFRTLPNYYLILLVNVALVYWGISDGKIEQFSWKFVLFVHNFHEGFYGFFWESWSLSIEEWFYIFMPILFIVGARFAGVKRALLIAITVLILFPLVWRIWHYTPDLNLFWWDVNFKKVVLTRLDAIVFGVLAAYVKLYHERLWKKVSIPAFVAGLIIVYTVILWPKAPKDFFTQTFYFSCLSVGFMCMLPLADSVKSFKTRFGRWMTHVSIISYSMYLLNLGVLALVIRKHFMPATELNAYLMYVFYWVLVVVLSTWLYKWFERPMMNLRDRF